MRVAAQHEPRFDPIADAREPDLLDAAATVLVCEFFGRDSSCFEDARIPHELLCRGGPRRVYIRHRLRGRFDGGLARTLGAGASTDAVLTVANADDRGGRCP